MIFSDDNNTRVLFERVLAILGKDVAWPIWNQFLQVKTYLCENFLHV